MKCKFCGHENSSTSIFCAECGRELETQTIYEQFVQKQQQELAQQKSQLRKSYKYMLITFIIIALISAAIVTAIVVRAGGAEDRAEKLATEYLEEHISNLENIQVTYVTPSFSPTGYSVIGNVTTDTTSAPFVAKVYMESKLDGGKLISVEVAYREIYNSYIKGE